MNQPPRRRYTRQFTLTNLNYLHQSSKIWLNPDYQRESVWTLPQKQKLIDSFIQDIDVPKLYFREITKDGYEYEVVDGQQRLRTIFSFFNDEFKLSLKSEPIDGEETAGKVFTELSTDLQMKLRDTQVDAVTLAYYSDDDIDEMFLRLQNGTPLNAAEKRRAIPGNMREIVKEMSRHKVFTLCAFSGTRYGYEDAVAKLLHEIFSPVITDIKPASIAKTYEFNRDIASNNTDILLAKKSLNFLHKTLKDKNPGFKKYSIITLGHLVSNMLNTYDLSEHPDEFATAYINFERRRVENKELPEDKQDSRLSAFTDAARADSIQDLQYRYDELLKEFVRNIPALKLKDPTRDFTEEQRLAIYWKDEGICQNCGAKCKENAFHADHIKPHSKGYLTSLSNGQVLCPRCNLQKSNKA